MGRRCRHMLPAPLPPLVLLWFLATPLVDTVTPRAVEGSRDEGSKHVGDGSVYSEDDVNTIARYNSPPTIRHLLEWRSEDEDEDDAEDGSGASSSSSSSTTYPTHTPFVPSPTSHRLRHDKGPRRPHTSSPSSVSLVPWTVAASSSSLSPVVPRTSPSPSPSPSSPPSPDPSTPPRRRLRAHDACYSSNEVLLVVGVTCAVNFAFILVVVALVHVCNRQGAAKVVPTVLEYETPADGMYSGRRRAGASGSCGVHGVGDGTCDVPDARGGVDLPGGGGGAGVAGVYARVQEYVDSLPDALPPFHDDDDAGVEGDEEGGEDGEGGGVEAARANIRAPRRRSTLGLHAAFSMEQLLFVD